MLNKEKIISFIKEWKSTLIAVGVVLLVIISIFGTLLFPSVNEMSIGNSIAKGGYDQKMTYSTNEDSLEIYGMPVEDEGTAEYDGDVERKIIKNGNLSLVVKSVETAKLEVLDITKKYNGFVQSSNFREEDNYEYRNGERVIKNSTKSGYFDVKIPSKDFESAFNEYKGVALKVNDESVSGRDVTEEYVDLESQIKNKQAEIDQYKVILKKAEEVEDILKVTQYLNSAQLDLDRKQGRLNYLSNQVELSSIRIDIVSEEDVEVFGIVWSPLTELKHGFVNMLQDLKGFADMLIALVFKIPVLILNLALWVLGLYVVYRMYKIVRKKF